MEEKAEGVYNSVVLTLEKWEMMAEYVIGPNHHADCRENLKITGKKE